MELLDLNLNIVLDSVKQAVDNWKRLSNEKSLTQEEKESIFKKIKEIQKIIWE